MTDRTIILIDKRKFMDYKVSIPEDQSIVFENVMKAHGWRPINTGEHKNKSISIEMMMQEEK